MLSQIKSRIVPTPSGYLHIGNAFNFLLTALIVDFKKGKLHLRIDDFDISRSKRKFVEDIFVQLDWLGIEYDSGPTGPDELFSKYSQQLRSDYYFNAIEVIKKNKKIFACECSRSMIRQISNKRTYPGYCREKNIDLGNKNITWRVNVPEGTIVNYKTFFNSIKTINVNDSIGDFVIKRRDGLPAYQIISVVEDLEQGINLIVRGKDLLGSTGAQIFIGGCLNGGTLLESVFIHHNLIKNSSGAKISKTYGDLSLKELKKKNQNATFVFQETAKMLHLPHRDIITLDHLKELFKISINQQNFFEF